VKRVAIIIPARNEEETIGGLVKSLRETTYPNNGIVSTPYFSSSGSIFSVLNFLVSFKT
jgi:cellulose synthase/poly-beta-1,6-N-acetylglucosamine synthase-like glycosyltransferase